MPGRRYNSITDFVHEVKHFLLDDDHYVLGNFDNDERLKTIIVYFADHNIQRSKSNKRNLIIKVDRIKYYGKVIDDFNSFRDEENYIWFSENRHRQLNTIKKGERYQLVINCDIKSFISPEGKEIKYYDSFFKKDS